MVAIARALDRSARLLILDEPTASLDEKEVADLFAIMRRLRSEGMGIVFVTHFLDQVYSVTDRVTVLRNGTLVATSPTAELPRLKLVSQMLGRDFSEQTAAGAREDTSASSAPLLLSTRNLSRPPALHPVNLTLRRGEVLGLAGLLGSGRTELARLLFGIDRHTTGQIQISDTPAHISSPRHAIRHGLAFSSEDRKHEGILPNLSVRENLILALQAKRGAARALTRVEQEKTLRPLHPRPS